MNNLVVASEAIASGQLTRKRLNRDYERLYRNVYVPKEFKPTAHDRVLGAWLATGRTAVMVGLSAALLHGSRWIDDDIVPEVLATHSRAPSGIKAYRGELRADEVTRRRGIQCTSVVRTAFDLGRRLDGDEAVIQVDALLNRTRTPLADVVTMARRHAGERNLQRLRQVIERVDPEAESKQETMVRLLLVDGGLPRPVAQHWVGNRRVDLAWPEWKVGVEYDGAQHWTDKFTHGDDIARREFFAERDWRLVHVVHAHLADPAGIVARARKALIAAGWQG